jgi:hypothetical protein
MHRLSRKFQLIPHIVGALTAPTSMAPMCRWRSRPQHHKRKWASGGNSPNQRFSYSRVQAAVCSMLERYALRADPVCCFAELAVNFLVQSFMLPCCAIAFNDFSGTNIGMGFRSVVTDTDCYIVMERANHYRACRRQRISNDRSEIVGPAIDGHETSFSQLEVFPLKADHKNHARTNSEVGARNRDVRVPR